MARLASRAALVRADPSLGDRPDAIVDQRFDLTNGGAEIAVAFLNHSHDRAGAKRLKPEFDALLRDCPPGAWAAHDDVVYVYEVRK
jgi:hypothetical protein